LCCLNLPQVRRVRAPTPEKPRHTCGHPNCPISLHGDCGKREIPRVCPRPSSGKQLTMILGAEIGKRGALLRVCSTAIVGICASASTPRTSPGRMYGTLCLDRVRSTSLGGQAAVPASTRKFPIAGSNDILLMVGCFDSAVEVLSHYCLVWGEKEGEG
jgi:hypothetical protein